MKWVYLYILTLTGDVAVADHWTGYMAALNLTSPMANSASPCEISVS